MTPEAARAGRGARLTGRVRARDVYVVLSPPSRGAGRVQVSIDSRRAGNLVVRRQRLYTLARFSRPGEHVIALRPQAGVSAYSFTFG